jgi:hypothetical protein
MIPSIKCYVGVLAGDAKQPNIDVDFRRATYESIAGKQVWTWSVPHYEGAQKSAQYYAAEIGDSYFVLANSKPDFIYVANALASAGSLEPAPINVAGWKVFSAYSYWANRQFSNSDKSVAAGSQELTPDISAITFYADVDKREGFIWVLSSDKSMKTAPKVLPASEKGRWHSAEAGNWEAAIPLSKDQSEENALFQLFYCLGFLLSFRVGMAGWRLQSLLRHPYSTRRAPDSMP